MAAGASDGASEDSRRVVQADDILAAIERGEPVDYDGVIVEGDLDIGGLDLPTEYVAVPEFETPLKNLVEEFKIIESPIDITNSEIRGNVIFNYTIFKEHVNFENTNFTRSIVFTRSNFSESQNVDHGAIRNLSLVPRISGANFMRAVFSGGDAQFYGSRFKDADFGEAVFSGGDANFWNAEFSGGNALFGGAVFSGGDAKFWGAKFGGYADFSYAEFTGGNAYFSAEFSGGDANFVGAKFSGGDASFQTAEFSGGDAIFGGGDYVSNGKYLIPENFFGAEFSGGDANFQRAKFSGGDAKFWGSKFTGGDANFRHVEFSGGDAIFFNAQFSDNRNSKMDFTNTSFDGNAYFVESQFTTYADFREARFNGSLDITHSRFDRLEIEWDAIKDHLICDETVYVALVKNFNDLARTDDADDCYYEYRRESQKRKPLGAAKISDWLQWISYGYGVRPSHTITSSIIIIVFFGLLLKWRGGIQRFKYPCQAISQDISTYDALYFSTLTFVSQPPYNLGPCEESRWKYVVLVEDILGWIFLTLFVIALI